MPLSSLLRRTRPAVNKPPPPPPEQHPLFKLLNTSLGTWALSAIFLTLGPYVWQSLDNHFKKQVAVQAENYRRSRLIEEFSYRLSISYARLATLEQEDRQPKGKEPEAQQSLEWALGPLLTAADSGVPLFRENKDLSAVSLLAEIKISLENADPKLVPDSLIRAQHLRKRIDALSKVSRLIKQSANASKAADKLEEYLRDEVDYDLWQSTGYSYLNPSK
jgi:hypothetical protein